MRVDHIKDVCSRKTKGRAECCEFGSGENKGTSMGGVVKLGVGDGEKTR